MDLGHLIDLKKIPVLKLCLFTDGLYINSQRRRSSSVSRREIIDHDGQGNGFLLLFQII